LSGKLSNTCQITLLLVLGPDRMFTPSFLTLTYSAARPAAGSDKINRAITVPRKSLWEVVVFIVKLFLNVLVFGGSFCSSKDCHKGI
jgi:hypothetical protein